MRTLFEREVYIRLSEDGSHLVSTTRYGRFFTRTAEFDVNGEVKCDARVEDARESMDEKSLAPLKKRSSPWLSDAQ